MKILKVKLSGDLSVNRLSRLNNTIDDHRAQSLQLATHYSLQYNCVMLIRRTNLVPVARWIEELGDGSRKIAQKDSVVTLTLTILNPATKTKRVALHLPCNSRKAKENTALCIFRKKYVEKIYVF